MIINNNSDETNKDADIRVFELKNEAEFKKKGMKKAEPISFNKDLSLFI
jgi:hypothetical protein